MNSLSKLVTSEDAKQGLKQIVNIIKDKATDLISGNISTPETITNNISNTNSSGFYIKTLMALILIVYISWTLYLIFAKFKDDHERDYYNNINTLLFGNIGMIPLTFLVILFSMIYFKFIF